MLQQRSAYDADMGSRPSDSVLEASRRTLRRHGLQGLTVERIAQEAGVSRVTLHRHGITKGVILATLTEGAIASYRDALWPVMTGSGTGRERLELALERLCDVAEDELELLVALRAQTDAIFHEDSEGEALTRTEFTEPLERLLRDGATDGTLRETDYEQTATVLFNLVGWTYVHMRTGHRWRADHARGAIIDLVMAGLSPGDTARSRDS
jgi:AcrR family transcriptional regulator